MNARASVIIASRNHARYLPDAIASALAQTVPVDVIVIDDGSTDETAEVMDRYTGRIVPFYQPQRGVAAARNLGLEAAQGEFIQFLDADDVIYRDKIELQIAALCQWPVADWCICDTLIIDDAGNWQQLASERYGYKEMGYPSDLFAPLTKRNFIPIHAPLIRRTSLNGTRFHDGPLEDWAFWQQYSNAAPARWIPDALAEYRKRRGGRNSGT